MALSELALFVELSTNGGPVNGASVAVSKVDGSPVVLYADRDGTQTLSQPLVTNRGRAIAWVSSGTYKIDVAKTGVIEPYTQYVDVVNGDDFVSTAVSLSPQVFVQPTQPSQTNDYIWIQTGLGSGGTDWTIWFNDAS